MSDTLVPAVNPDDIDLLLEAIESHLAQEVGPTPEDLQAIENEEHSREPAPTPKNWRELAACRGVDPDLFFLERGDNRGFVKAKQVCGACPVRDRCLEEAIENGEEFGVWGGQTYSFFKKARLARKPSTLSTEQR